MKERRHKRRRPLALEIFEGNLSMIVTSIACSGIIEVVPIGLSDAEFVMALDQLDLAEARLAKLKAKIKRAQAERATAVVRFPGRRGRPDK